MGAWEQGRKEMVTGTHDGWADGSKGGLKNDGEDPDVGSLTDGYTQVPSVPPFAIPETTRLVGSASVCPGAGIWFAEAGIKLLPGGRLSQFVSCH